MRWFNFGLALLFATATAKTASGQLIIFRAALQSAFEHPRPTFKLPLPSGAVHTFSFSPTDFLPPDTTLHIRTFTGRSVDDPGFSANIVLSPTSLSAQIFSREGTHYLNSSSGSTNIHLEFASGGTRAEPGYHCLTDTGMQPTFRAASSSPYQNVLRRFRLAPAATAEFTQFHGSREAAVLEVVTAMNRASGIFERELGISFQLVSNFEQMIYNDPEADPYSSNDPSEQLLNEAQNAFDDVIGTENYDVGILLTRGLYGLAYFSSVCDPARKGSSCIGLPEPAGDAFHVNLVTHELGHQFGAKHTFNSPAGFCSERRDGFTAFEPGTGSTLMSYASLPCEGDSFQANNDAYFHSGNLQQILDFVNSGLASCAEVISRDNTAPTVNAGPEYTIPARTSFALTATGSDAENDTIFYTWEQRDLGPAGTLAAPDDGLGPLFRSYSPTTSPTRLFPRLERILAGTDAPEERLPSVARTMKFRVTARDSRNDGAVSFSDTQLIVVNTGAPFKITSHNSPVEVSGATLVEWDVAGTTDSPIHASHLRISLSVDGGQSFDRILAEATPNDGSYEVTLPEIATTDARIKIEAVDNIFFDINDAPITIVAAPGSVNLAAHRNENGTVRVSWNAEPGTNYLLERASTIPTNRWLEVLQTNAAQNSIAVDLPTIADRSFYRVTRP